MASNLIINSVTYDGTPLATAHPFKPDTITMALVRVGRVLVAASGKRRFVLRGTKRVWTIGWNVTNETTRAAVRTLASLSTTFTFVDQLSVSYTCQCEETDYSEDYAQTDPAGNVYYTLKLTVREA